MEELKHAAKEVSDKESFVQFLEKLTNDLKSNQGLWENRDLESFLEAMASWIEDMDGYYINQGVDMPSNVNWKVFADALMAARIYE